MRMVSFHPRFFTSTWRYGSVMIHWAMPLLKPTFTPILGSGSMISTTPLGRTFAVSNPEGDIIQVVIQYLWICFRSSMCLCLRALLLFSFSPCGRASRICSVSFLPKWPQTSLRLHWSHWECAHNLRGVHAAGNPELSQWLPLFVLGTVHWPAPLVLAVHQRSACLHLPGVRHPPAQPLDRRHHCKSAFLSP